MLFNTWMWSVADDRAVAWTGRLLGSRVGRVLYERAGLSVNVIWARAIRDRTRYTPAVHRHYARPLDTPAARRATWEYARELLGSSDWYESLWRQRERLRKLPALLVWGLADPAFGRFLPRWRTVFDDAEVLEFIIPANSAIVGKTLKELEVPMGAIIGVIVRGEQVVIPGGEDHLEADDHVVVFALPEAIAGVERFFS